MVLPHRIPEDAAILLLRARYLYFVLGSHLYAIARTLQRNYALQRPRGVQILLK